MSRDMFVMAVFVVVVMPVFVMNRVVVAFVTVFALPMFVLVFSRTLGSSCHVVSLEEVYETHYWLTFALYIGISTLYNFHAGGLWVNGGFWFLPRLSPIRYTSEGLEGFHGSKPCCSQNPILPEGFASAGQFGSL